MGRCISHMEMLHMLLQYPEVLTNLKFIKVSTIPLELCAGIPTQKQFTVEDGAFVTSPIDNYKQHVLSLELWRNFADNQVLLMKEIKLSKLTIGQITQFGLQPPEILHLFNKLKQYYWWFFIPQGGAKVSMFANLLSERLEQSSWIDGLQG